VPSKQQRVLPQAQNRKGGDFRRPSSSAAAVTRNAEAGSGDIRRIAQRGSAGKR
jgi:hypothetical protein